MSVILLTIPVALPLNCFFMSYGQPVAQYFVYLPTLSPSPRIEGPLGRLSEPCVASVNSVDCKLDMKGVIGSALQVSNF